MSVCGFTFVRNAVRFQYPVVESIMSALPLCDKFIVAVGNSDDGTLDLIKSMPSEKIEIIQTVWDDSQRKGGRVLALETDKALQAVPDGFDWCLYLQADEVLHEQDYPAIRQALDEFMPQADVEGLLFNYIHFYGSFDYVGESFRWYRREIRIIRNRKDIFSYRDAQGFRIKPNRKLRVKHIDATVYHYGWVREPAAMEAKQNNFIRLYRPDFNTRPSAAGFDYSRVDALRLFEGTHPAAIRDRIQRKNWTFDYDISRNKLSLKDRFKRAVERITGWRPGEYKNYRIM